MPDGSSAAAAGSFSMGETTSVVGIAPILTAAWAVPPPFAASEPEPHAVSSSAADVIRAKGMNSRLRARVGVVVRKLSLMLCGLLGAGREKEQRERERKEKGVREGRGVRGCEGADEA